ncbi:MAG: preprotein translocase subunit SecG [Proteobacteria bacterium]|nr:preprotein translocase subunit SecG [Pseudomonadota bacterium]
MDTIQKGVLIAHTLIALGIILLVLMQRGKGADAGAGFGAGASGTVFGARGSGSFFSRATGVLATAFFASSLTLAYLSSQRSTDPEERLIENVQPLVDPVESVPELTDELAVDEMPALEPEQGVEDAAELPASEGE